MDQSETARIIAMAASVDHRVPPLNRTGPDERVPVWQMVLADLDYNTAQQAVLEIARSPEMVAIRPGDIYQATKRVMRRHLATVDVTAIEPPDDMTTQGMLDWKRAVIRAVGRGAGPDQARAEADQATGATRRGLPRTPRNMRELMAGKTPSPEPVRNPTPDAIRAELEQLRNASHARGHDTQETP